MILLLQDGKILQNVRVAKDIYEMVLEAPEIAKSSKPGQFVNLKLSEKLDPLLRRPISLHRIEADRGTLALLYLVVGKGTAMMSRMEPGETLNVLGPLGNGWDCALPGQHAVLVGGGIGIAPLYPLAKALTAAGKQVSLIMGAKNSAYLTDSTDYAQLGAEVCIATDDGSAGTPGLVTAPLQQLIAAGRCDLIYACGPVPMLRAVEETALDHGIPGQVSTEAHMGCGLGVCLLCPNKVKSGGYKHTCVDGPVFAIGELDYA